MYYHMTTHEDADTSMLHHAIFNYIHCLYGIRYDDYHYGEVNQLLEHSLKVYIKTVTCYPERTTCHIPELLATVPSLREGPCEPATDRGTDAGRTAVRPVSHHSIHDPIGHISPAGPH